MIIIKLQGGLGNQLFQYCFARSLSYKLNKELYLDLSFFNHGIYRHGVYGLHPFNTKGNVGFYPYIDIRNYELFFNIIYKIKNFPLIRNNHMLNKFYKYLENNTEHNIKFFFKYPIHSNSYIINNNTLSFDNIKTPAYFEGYFNLNNDSKNKLFISERFFKKYNKLLHEDLQYLPNLTEESQNIFNKMEESNSVLLHIRHGDYTGLLDYGLCSEEYYKKSMDIIASKIDNPKFFIFSDDIEGAKKFKFNYPHVFVDFKENTELNGRGNGELLKLMSSCKHFIIANSTLSWWAAFLSENENKIIITPEPWFQNRRVFGVETIDNKETIKVINNNKKLFDNSQKIISKINENEFLFRNIEFTRNKDFYQIDNIKNNAEILLKNKNDYSNSRFIVKLSLKSNHFNCLKIQFKTKDNDKYCDENTFNIYYYEDDDFEHYLLFPKGAILDDLKIMPGNPFKNETDYITIKSIEIRELNK